MNTIQASFKEKFWIIHTNYYYISSITNVIIWQPVRHYIQKPVSQWNYCKPIGKTRYQDIEAGGFPPRFMTTPMGIGWVGESAISPEPPDQDRVANWLFHLTRSENTSQRFKQIDSRTKVLPLSLTFTYNCSKKSVPIGSHFEGYKLHFSSC